MKRRRVLAGAGSALASAVAGCLEDDATARMLSLASVDDGPDRLSFDVDVIESQLSESEIPLLDISAENVGTQAATWTQASAEFVFPARSTTPDNILAIGLEDEVRGLLVDSDGCARTQHGVGRDDVEVTTELLPGEAFEQRYAMAGHGSHVEESCPPADTYRAEFGYDDHGVWGFEVTVE